MTELNANGVIESSMKKLQKDICLYANRNSKQLKWKLKLHSPRVNSKEQLQLGLERNDDHDDDKQTSECMYVSIAKFYCYTAAYL